MPADSSSIMDDALARLNAVREKRGYLLPHHGLLAITAPQLLDGYDACYSALTLQSRNLPEYDKEFIWLGILTMCDEHLAPHHLVRFKAAGGSDTDVGTAVRLASLALGASAYGFIPKHWPDHAPGIGHKASYLEALRALVQGSAISPALTHLAMAANHTCRKAWHELRWHIAEAYQLGIDESILAEALSYTMFTASVPYFVEACGIWRDMISAGEIKASQALTAWAAIDADGLKPG